MPTAWEIVPFAGPDGLRQLEADWRRLLADMPGHGPQHRYETHWAYFSHISRAGGAYTCLALSDGQRLRAICPVEPGHMVVFGLTLPVLELPARLWDLTRDLVCPPGEAERQLMPAVLTWLRRQAGRPAWLVMDHVLEDSAAARCMCALPARDWCQAERGVSAVFACDRPASDFRARLSRKFRANLRSAERRLALAGEVQFQTYADPAGLRRAYPEFLVLEAAGWKGAGGERGAIRLKPAELAFYDELVSMASRLPAGASVAAPACEIHALYLSGACVASALCLRGGGEMAVPKIAYSEAHARLAPGHLLLQHLIGRCMQDTTLQRLNMVSHAAWLAPWQPQAVGQRRVVIGLGRWDGPLRVALLAAGERGWSRWRQGYAGLARWPAAQADRPPAPKRAERMAITTCATFEAYSALLAALPPKDPDGHLGLSAAWAASVMPLWPAGDFFLGLRVAVAADGSRAAGAGLLALSRGVRSSPCSRGHLSLGFNEPSSPDFSGTSTEANGLIGSPPGGFDGWVPAILQHLATVPGWDELRINALSDADAGCFVQAAADLGLLAHVFGERQTYWVDLDGLRERHGGDYLASRSVNTRQQLRSAIKRLRVEQGGFSLTRAATRAQGHEWLDALSVLHRQRWNAHGETGGFANPAFARYHHALVEQMLDSGGVEVLRAAAGDQTVAYLYNFVVDGRVYFDMSGVDHGRYARYRPGLLAHWQAIEWYQQRGMRIYDFQAGTNRYKQSLATHSANRVDLILRRPWFKFKVEAAARWLKRQMAHDEPPAGSRRTD